MTWKKNFANESIKYIKDIEVAINQINENINAIKQAEFTTEKDETHNIYILKTLVRF